MGLGVGKWLPNVGAVCTVFTATLIVSAGVVAVALIALGADGGGKV